MDMDWQKGRFEIFVFHAGRAELEDAGLLQRFLGRLVELTGMRNMTEPRSFRVAPTIAALHGDPEADEGGVSGDALGFAQAVHADVMIGTSHYSIHTWTDPAGKVRVGGAVLTMYSCRDFDSGQVRKLIREMLAGEQVQSTDVSRALRMDNFLNRQEHALRMARTYIDHIAGPTHFIRIALSNALE